jgi:hypothetical protein
MLLLSYSNWGKPQRIPARIFGVPAGIRPETFNIKARILAAWNRLLVIWNVDYLTLKVITISTSLEQTHLKIILITFSHASVWLSSLAFLSEKTSYDSRFRRARLTRSSIRYFPPPGPSNCWINTTPKLNHPIFFVWQFIQPIISLPTQNNSVCT